MEISPPADRPPVAPSRWENEPEGGLRPEDWLAIPALPPLVLSNGQGSPLQETRLRLAWSATHLHVLFECVDDEAWGTFVRRDDPLYQEEVVEIFLAPGAETPTEYFEIEVSPLGTLFDARISNPSSRRSDLIADLAWDCPELRWRAGRGAERQDWWAALAIPWASVGAETGANGPSTRVWRANFYRIDRPPGRAAEYSAWSPTLAEPADFHLPGFFGTLVLGAGDGAATDEIDEAGAGASVSR